MLKWMFVQKRPLGDAMPLAMANVFQLLMITSGQNMPIVAVTPQSIIYEASIVACTLRDAGHYDT